MVGKVDNDGLTGPVQFLNWHSPTPIQTHRYFTEGHYWLIVILLKVTIVKAMQLLFAVSRRCNVNDVHKVTEPANMWKCNIL